ncbi:methyltransferase domain-containing protein, partial [bacterium]
ENEWLSFIQGDVHNLPFNDNSFDTVYCRYILEHVTQPQTVLTEAARVLKPGGRIFIQENSILLLEFHPDCPSFRQVWKAFAAYQAATGGDAMIGIKLFEKLKLSGFVVDELSMAPELHYFGQDTFTPWIDNLIGNIKGVKDPLIRQQYVSAEEFNLALQEMGEFKSNELASTYFYWNRAKASKKRNA